MNARHVLALGFIPGITTATLRALVESGASFKEIVDAAPEDLAALGVRRTAIEGMRAIGDALGRATEQIELAERFGARLVQFWDDDYPAALRAIDAPPITLYTYGKLNQDDANAIAIVGTRGASVYGRLTAERYAGRFAEAGITVISGLARGIDTYAHVATLTGGGRTIAVVASGLDQIQPAYAAQLAGKIAAQGAVVSEYPFGAKALRPYFPQRNRIISGMSGGTVVVESDMEGGAMITAGFAADQQRKLFAVPGPISSPKSRGPNLLIRTGRALLTQSPDDILAILGYRIASPADGDIHAVGMGNLSLFEQQIYHVLQEEPVHVDTICATTGLASSDVLVHLLALEFKGLVRQMAGRMFVKGRGSGL